MTPSIVELKHTQLHTPLSVIDWAKEHNPTLRLPVTCGWNLQNDD